MSAQLQFTVLPASRGIQPGRWPGASANALVGAIFVEAAYAGYPHLWVCQVVRLAAPLGLNERTVRTSLQRLMKQGSLCAVRIGRQSVYGLVQAPCDAHATGTGAPTDWDGRWTIVTQLGRQRRLAAKLHAMGFRAIAPGILALPGADFNCTASLAASLAPARGVLVFDTSCIGGLTAAQLDHVIASAWQLNAEASLVRSFKASCRGALAALDALTPVQCYALYLRLRHEWRQLAEQAPQLPCALLPPDWPAPAARRLLMQTEQALAAPAAAFMAGIIQALPGATAAPQS